MSRQAIAGVLLCLLALPVHAAFPLVITDDRNHTVRLDAAPQRIISLLPSITETICVLNRCDTLVGTDRFSNWPDKIKHLPKLGGLEDTQVERIVALRPDLVVVPPASRVIDRLKALGLRVAVLEARSRADIERVTKTLVTVLGLPDDQGMLQRMQAAVQQQAASIPPNRKGQRVYFEIDNSPYAAGASSFIGEVLSALSLRNIIGPELGPFPRINPELVVRADPDLIIVSQRNSPGMLSRPGWSQLKAIREQQVCVIDPEQYDVVVRPGPRIAEAAKVLAQCVQRHGAVLAN
jgi:iron complex transport system substrate-binding protein